MATVNSGTGNNNVTTLTNSSGATLATVPNLAAPEMWPGGYNSDEANVQRWRNLQNYINVLTTQVNSLAINIGSLASSQFGSATVAARLNLNTNDAQTLKNKALLKTPDGQIVCVFYDDRAAGSGTASTGLYAIKAKSPYTVWTSLDGTSRTPTTIKEFALASGSTIPYCCAVDSVSGNLHVLYRNDLASNPFTMESASYQLSSVTGQYGTGTVSSTTISTAPFNGDMICTTSGTFLTSITTGSGVANNVEIWKATASGTGLNWSRIQQYNAIWQGAGYNTANRTLCQQSRFAKWGNNIVLFWDFTYTSTSGGFAYAWSQDNGVSWPAGDQSGGGDLRGWGNSSSTRTGLLYPVLSPGTLKPVTTGFGSGDMLAPRWDVAAIGSTGRVGIVYRRNNTQSSPAAIDTSGMYYGEWNISQNSGRGGFVSASSHILLDSNPYSPGQSIQASTGYPRLFWLSQYNQDKDALSNPPPASEPAPPTGSAVTRMTYVGGQSLTDGLSVGNWSACKLYSLLDNIQYAARATSYGSSDNTVHECLTVCRDTVTVNGVVCIPVVMARYDQNRYIVYENAGFPNQWLRIPKGDLLFKLLPVTALDSPF